METIVSAAAHARGILLLLEFRVIVCPKLPMSRTPRISGFGTAIGAAGFLGALSTLGDWVWVRFIPDGAVVPGVVHGMVIFVALALVLGWAAGSRRATWRLLAALPLAGLLIAALFYPLAYAIGYLQALIVTWALMWLTLAVSQRWASQSREALSRSMARGLVAALGSGLAFWAISGMWTNSGLAAGNYPLRLSLWTLAFVPGFLALIVVRRPSDP